jgi:hypothetical protein
MSNRTPLSISFEQRILSNISQRIPIIIQTLANLCQILNDYPLTQIKISEIEQGTIDCILWNDDQSYPIGIDQNKYLIEFRQIIREILYEFLEFTQQIDKNDEIQKAIKYLITLNNYRTQRQSAYNYFCQNSTSEDAILILNNIDKQQYYQLRLIALYLRQEFLKLIKYFTPKFSLLTYD